MSSASFCASTNIRCLSSFTHFACFNSSGSFKRISFNKSKISSLLTTVLAENADQILVIDGGTVVQKGTHKELLKQKGTYRDFISIREQAEGWRIQ